MALAISSAALTAAFCYPAWPGFMSYDSLLAYQQARYGVQTALWPPLHTYLFALSRAAGADTWGLFVVQTFSVLFGAGLALHVLTPGRRLAWLLWLLFVGGLLWFSTLVGTLMHQWRDVPTGGFALLGFGLWLAAVQARSTPLLAAAILSMIASLSLRYNAFVLVAPAFALILWRPFLDNGRATAPRLVAASIIALGLAAAWASSQWRLPDLLRLPDAENFAATQLFDLVGISACSGTNYLPAAVTAGQPISMAQIRRAYDPRHMHLTLGPKPGQPAMLETSAGGEVPANWRKAVTREPGCYLAHRAAVMVEQMGLLKDGVFYPTHGLIDTNPFGLALRHRQAADAMNAYIHATANEPWRRPALLYGLAAVLGLGATMRARRHAWLILALLAGAFAYPALLFIAAPAADARYIFPSNALCLLIALASLGLLAGRRA